MLSDEVKEILAERLTNRIEKVNTYILKDIANKLDEIGKTTPTSAYKLAQILKSGGDFNKIIEELKKTNNLNQKEIDEIFDEVAKTNYLNSRELYEIKNKGFIPYNQNTELIEQVELLKKITKDSYKNFSNTRAIGYTIRDKDGNLIFRDISDTYKDVIDEATLSVVQGKDVFDREVRRIIKQLGNSGLKTVDYESGRTMRLDSAVRMNIQGAVRDLENNMQLTIGEQTDCDGIEITVHEYPAPDHEPIQGHQFYKKEFEKLQNGERFKDVENTEFEGIKRHIGEYNCYHNIFAITVGISKPRYSKKDLEEVIERNNEPIEIDGKKYTKYECSQLQRKLETEIRKNKDIQIMARENPDLKDLVFESQRNIEQLKNKYIEISEKAGLKTRLERMRVSGYRYIKEPKVVKTVIPSEPAIVNSGKLVNERKPDLSYNEVVKDLKKKNVDIDLGMGLDNKAITECLNEANDIIASYPKLKKSIKEKRIEIFDDDLGRTTYMSASSKYTRFDSKKFKDGNYENLLNDYKKDMELNSDGSIGWHYKVPDDKAIKSIISHEFGHTIEFRYIKEKLGNFGTKKMWQEQDTAIMNSIYFRAMEETGMSKVELKKKYLTEYAKSKRYYESFAELFSGLRNEIDNPMTRALKKWLEEFYE